MSHCIVDRRRSTEAPFCNSFARRQWYAAGQEVGEVSLSEWKLAPFSSLSRNSSDTAEGISPAWALSLKLRLR
jgi:hypothetical protein